MKYEIEADALQPGWWIVRRFIDGTLAWSTKVKTLDAAIALVAANKT